MAESRGVGPHPSAAPILAHRLAILLLLEQGVAVLAPPLRCLHTFLKGHGSQLLALISLLKLQQLEFIAAGSRAGRKRESRGAEKSAGKVAVVCRSIEARLFLPYPGHSLSLAQQRL
jgi:hypothetical protein